MPSRVLSLLSVLLLLGVPSLHAQDASLTGFAPTHAETQRACEAQLADRVSSDAFRTHLKRLTRAPHPAGTPANDRVRAYIDSVMTAAGLSTTAYPYDLYMPSPASAYDTKVALVTPERQPLNRQEYIHDADRFSGHPDLRPAWNAYSGSGDVTAEVVYANYGRKADFETLDSLDVDLNGKIVVARYGGNFRGFKAKYAEEYGILGSTEWVEQLEDSLRAGAVAYLNADGAVSGSTFGGAAAPSLKGPMLDAAKAVPYPGAEADTTSVYDHLAARTDTSERLGNLGGGSDHVGFYTYAGVPSWSGGFSGTTPVYHSAYDTFAWYERFADTSFVYGPALAQLDGTLALRLANADVLPYDVPRYAEDLRRHVETVAEAAEEHGRPPSFGPLRAALDTLAQAADAFVETRDARLADGPPPNPTELNRTLRSLEQAFQHEGGMPFGDQYRSLYASPNPFNGYASWMLPGLRYPIETDAPDDSLARWTTTYRAAIERLTDRVRSATAQLHSR